MREILKRIPIAEDLIRRNPLFYARFRRLLDEASVMSEAERRALQAKLLARSLAWASALPGYREVARKGSLDGFPILSKHQLQANAGDFLGGGLTGVRATTGGSSGRP